jgi:AraC-like DNA-binding protein
MMSIYEGELTVVANGQKYVIKKGDTVLIPKGVAHRFWNSGDDTAHYYQLKFTVLSKSLLQVLDTKDAYIVGDELSGQLAAHIYNEYLESRILKEEFGVAALKTLMLHITTQARGVAGQEQTVIDTTGFSQLAKSVISFLADHYSEDISLDSISTGVGITKNYLCNAFKKNTGTTINSCLNMIRIRKAAELIVYSDLPLPQVAQACGYISASHFNRVFMRYVGLPPGQCRRAFSFDKLSEARRSPGTFMYSVLAGKSFTSDMINEFEQHRKEEK